MEKKGSFECPQYLIEELTALLPQVTQILVIGWRATEAHFLALLSKHLRHGVYLSVVAGGRTESEEVMVRINRALLNNPPSPTSEPVGFTQFIRSRRAEQILGVFQTRP